jgi:hypothetical protein
LLAARASGFIRVRGNGEKRRCRDGRDGTAPEEEDDEEQGQNNCRGSTRIFPIGLIKQK